MKKWTVILDYTCAITVYAETSDEAEQQGAGTDATEVLDNLGTGTVIDVTEEEAGECERCGHLLETEDDIEAGKCGDCVAIDNKEDNEEEGEESEGLAWDNNLATSK